MATAKCSARTAISSPAAQSGSKGIRWAADYDCRRPRLIHFFEAQNVRLENLCRCIVPASGTVHICYSQDVTVYNVIIRNNSGRGRTPTYSDCSARGAGRKPGHCLQRRCTVHEGNVRLDADLVVDGSFSLRCCEWWRCKPPSWGMPSAAPSRYGGRASAAATLSG